MTSTAEVSQIAQRVLRAFEDPTRRALRQELGLAERFASHGRVREGGRTERNWTSEEERSELLGAIAVEMRVALEGGVSGSALQPHQQLLRHLSRPAPRPN